MAFDIPTNLYPTSSSSSSSSSWNGINWNSPFIQGILPSLTSSALKVPKIAEALPGFLQGQYNSMMKEAMGPTAFQGTLDTLAAKNILRSSVASDAMSKVASEIAKAIAKQGWQAQLAGQQAMMNVPSILAQLAQLGQESRSSSSSSSSQSDPLAPYRLIAEIMMSQQNA